MWLYTIHHCRVLVIVITITSWWPHLAISSTSTLDTFLETSNTLWYRTIFMALLTYVTLSLSPHLLSLSLSLSPFIVAQGFKREWAPFVPTPDFVWVMGGEVYTAETKIKWSFFNFWHHSLYRIAARLKHTRTCVAERFWSYADTQTSSSTFSH